MTARRYRTVLTIAGSDGSGGAGIQADLKTISALGCYGLSVVTGVTAQNTTGVAGSFALPAVFVEQQFEVLAEDIAIDAVKIGMLSTEETVLTVSRMIRRHIRVPVVLDTVLRSSSGMPLLEDRAVEAMKRELFPLASLITPNLQESAVLAGTGTVPSSRAEMEETAARLLQEGACAVLVKGGHLSGNSCDDFLLSESGGEWFRSPRIATPNTHGTGCTLSSSIAAHLAKGCGLRDAVLEGKRYTREALRAGALFSLGKGHGPLHHFFGCGL